MNIQKDSYLSQLNFEDKSYLLSIYESINKSPPDNLISSIKPFMSFQSTIKLKLKAEEHSTNGQSNDDMISSGKIFIIFLEISQFQAKFEHNSEIESNFLIESSLLVNDIYKVLSLKEANFNDKKNELDIVISLIFSKYIDDIHCYLDFVNFIENKTRKNNKEKVINNTILSYEQFQKYFKIVIKFCLFSKGIERVYNILAKNDKVTKTDMVDCYNKIIKNLNESNLFYLVAKKIIDMVDINQTFIEKYKYYTICIRALS